MKWWKPCEEATGYLPPAYVFYSQKRWAESPWWPTRLLEGDIGSRRHHSIKPWVCKGTFSDHPTSVTQMEKRLGYVRKHPIEIMSILLSSCCITTLLISLTRLLVSEQLQYKSLSREKKILTHFVVKFIDEWLICCHVLYVIQLYTVLTLKFHLYNMKQMQNSILIPPFTFLPYTYTVFIVIFSFYFASESLHTTLICIDYSSI